METEEEKEECEWCNTTGDVEKNRRIYWLTVLLIFLVVLSLYLLTVLL